MKLLPEFQKVLERALFTFNMGNRCTTVDAITLAVKECQELALRRPEMSDAEKLQAFYKGGCESFSDRAKQLIDAYESKRFQPIKRVVKCRLYRNNMGVHCSTDYGLEHDHLNNENVEWLGPIFEREIEQ